VSDWTGGRDRRAERLQLVEHATPKGCVAAYYPETNPLVPLDSQAAESGTPTSKWVIVRLEPVVAKWCGYDDLTEGLARMLASSPPTAHADTRSRLTRQLRWLTMGSPHSYERASYVRSLLLLDAQGTTRVLPVHLLDCEPEVRLLAAQHTPLDEDAHRWLNQLRDDPVEDEAIRHAAAQRTQAA